MNKNLNKSPSTDKYHLVELDMAIARLEYRVERQSAWILLLTICVIVLGVAVVFLTLL